MFTEEAFNAAAEDLARANGLTLDQAADYLAQLGDTPELAADGRAIVRDEAGREIAHIFFE